MSATHEAFELVTADAVVVGYDGVLFDVLPAVEWRYSGEQPFVEE